MSAAQYYSDNYNIFKDIVESFDPDDAVSIRDCQKVLRDPSLLTELAFIKVHFLSLKYGILKLEELGNTLKEQLEVISTIKDKLPNNQCSESVSKKLDIVLKKT